MSGQFSKEQLAKPNIRLVGHVDEAMYAEYRRQLGEAADEDPLVVSITTLGGDPEVARAIGDDIRLMCEIGERDTVFLGKAAVYSAGATLMSAFPIEKRFLTRKTRIMIHERQLAKTIELNGPLRSCVDQLKAALHEIEHSIDIENDGFRQIIDGSKIDFETIREKATDNWYIDCEEALEYGLVAGIV